MTTSNRFEYTRVMTLPGVPKEEHETSIAQVVTAEYLAWLVRTEQSAPDEFPPIILTQPIANVLGMYRVEAFKDMPEVTE